VRKVHFGGGDLGIVTTTFSPCLAGIVTFCFSAGLPRMKWIRMNRCLLALPMKHSSCYSELICG